MENVLTKIWELVDLEKMANEGAGVTYYESIDDMAEQLEMGVEEIQDKTATNDVVVADLKSPFIVYDYNVAEFEFLTSDNPDAIRSLVDRINNI